MAISDACDEVVRHQIVKLASNELVFDSNKTRCGYLLRFSTLHVC